MKSIIKLSAVIGTVGMLASCAAGNSVAQVSAMPDNSGAFNAALHKQYIERAEHEVDEKDLRATEFFRVRAEMAANGKTPVVQNPNQRKLLVDSREINQAYPILASALKSNAPQTSAVACARAQTWYEMWMEQSAEGYQVDDIANARAEFEAAMTQCPSNVAQVQPKANVQPKASVQLPMDMPGTFIIFFDHNSSAMTSDGVNILDHAVNAGQQAHASRATVVGHTDRSGSNAYNMSLSERRAHTVAVALRNAGVPTVLNADSYAGETDLQVDTENGVREPMNRRAVISFVR